MEQVKDPKGLATLSTSRPVAFDGAEITSPHKSAKAAWTRLTEVSLDPDVLLRSKIVSRAACKASLPIDILRTRLLNQMKTNGHRRLAVTSPTRGCGKTTLVTNLALSLARRHDLRTIIFDFDFRNPTMIHQLGLVEEGPRFSALSGTRRNFESSCLRVRHNLALSLNNTKPSNPAELLGSKRTRDLIELVETDFRPDVMLFDLSPLLPFDDARAALDIADCAVLVAMANRSTTHEVDQAQSILTEHGNSLGVVLNKCQFTKQSITRKRPGLWRSKRREAHAIR